MITEIGYDKLAEWAEREYLKGLDAMAEGYSKGEDRIISDEEDVNWEE